MRTNNKIYFILLSISLILFSCSESSHDFDAAGTFEAKEIIISSEANGKIIFFDLEEGAQISKGDTIAKVDVNHLFLQETQIYARLNALQSKLAESYPQTLILKEQLKVAHANIEAQETQFEVLQKEEKRIQKLREAEAATAQQLDEISGKVKVMGKQLKAAHIQLDVLNVQIKSAKQTAALQNKGVLGETAPIEAQLKIIQDQINKASILSPTDGNLIAKFAEAGELTGMGKPVAKIANLEEMDFKAYISGDQLGAVQLNQNVRVHIDQNDGAYKTYPGSNSWISDKAEFTPKSIQTKNERANLVYALKVKVQNDGDIKIGMYGELSLNAETSEDE